MGTYVPFGRVLTKGVPEAIHRLTADSPRPQAVRLFPNNGTTDLYVLVGGRSVPLVGAAFAGRFGVGVLPREIGDLVSATPQPTQVQISAVLGRPGAYAAFVDYSPPSR